MEPLRVYQRKHLTNIPPLRGKKTHAKPFGTLLLFFSVIIASGLFIVSPHTWKAPLRALTESIKPELRPATPETPSVVEVDPWNVNDAVTDFQSIHREFGIGGVEELSRQCYKDLHHYRSYRLLDRCFAFDTVAGFWWAKTSQSAHIYFDPKLQNRRYWTAAARLSGDPRLNAARKIEIERLTFSAIAFYFTPGERSDPDNHL